MAGRLRVIGAATGLWAAALSPPRALAWPVATLATGQGAPAASQRGAEPDGAARWALTAEMGRLVAEAETVFGAAREWWNRNVSREEASRLMDAARADAEALWQQSLGVARADLDASLGLRAFEPPGGSGPDDHADWRALNLGETLPDRIVLLVHGLDEAGSIWQDADEPLAQAGHRVLRFDYPNDEPIAASAELLGRALRDLRGHGVQRVDAVCHSMGGLLARDVLTRASFYGGDALGRPGLPDLERLIMMGTPNQGSELAPLRPVMEVRDHLVRWIESRALDPRLLLGGFVDGDGEAGADLRPGSPFLTDLNSRPLPRGVRITTIIGTAPALSGGELQRLLSTTLARRVLCGIDAPALLHRIDELSAGIGDGCVSVESARLAGVTDEVRMASDHRSMIERPPLLDALRRLLRLDRARPPAVAVILERLGEPG